MKMIVISEESFNKLFDETLKELELEKLRDKYFGGTDSAERLHRKFHYEVAVLKDKIARSQ